MTQKQKQNDWKAQPNSSEHDKSTIRVVKINYPHRKQINKEAQFLINPILNDKFFFKKKSDVKKQEKKEININPG